MSQTTRNILCFILIFIVNWIYGQWMYRRGFDAAFKQYEKQWLYLKELENELHFYNRHSGGDAND